MILGIVESINKMSDSLKDWMIQNGGNPILWICLFFAGVLIFFVTYHALHKQD